MSRIGPQPRSVEGFDVNDQPSNADLARLIREKHEETSQRLRAVEHHLIDTRFPERTLPIRVRELERAHRFIKVVGGTVGGSMLAAIGTWLWDKWQRGGPH